LLVALAGVSESLRLIVFPLPIGYANDFLLASSLTPLRAAAGLLLGAGLVWGLVWSGRRGFTGAFWIAMVLFPAVGASGIVFPTGAILPPRALLFLLLGVAGLVAWGAQWALTRRSAGVSRIAVPVLGATILGLACWRTLDRTNDYRDWEVLVQRQTIEFPRSAQGWFDLGNIRLTRGQQAAARAAYDEALTLRPDYWEAWINLGVIEYNQEERGLAMRAFTHVVDGTAGSKSLRVVHARARFHQGLVFLTQTKNVEAARCFEDMLTVFPNHLYSHANLGMLYSNSEYLDDRARMHLERALQLETVPERRTVIEGFLDTIAKRREKKERHQERISGGSIPGAASSDSLP
jgi:tetratricopeptide (TPR) repeat protein